MVRRPINQLVDQGIMPRKYFLILFFFVVVVVVVVINAN